MTPILMLTKDRLKLTKQAVASVLENTVIPFTLFIFDNASEDGTWEWLEQTMNGRPNVAIWHAPENLGIHGGMDFFHGFFPEVDYYAKVDNDTVVPQNWLGKLISSLAENRVDLIGSLHHTCSQSVLQAMQKAESEGFCPFPSPGGSGIVYRREFVKDGMVAKDARAMMDGWTKYCHRMVRNGFKAGFCGDVRIKLLDMADHFERREGYGDTCDVLGQPSLRG